MFAPWRNFYKINELLIYIGGKIFYGGVKSFTTKAFPTLGNGAVDMGLSVKWSSCNVGADLPEEVGYKYAWGEVETKASYTASNYQWWQYSYWESDDDCGSSTYVKKYGSSYSYSRYEYYDNTKWINDEKTMLDSDDDAAHVEWRGTWRMPTAQECRELIENSVIELVRYNNVNGLLAISKITGNAIFFPYGDKNYVESVDVSDNYGYFYDDHKQYYHYPCCWSASQYYYYPLVAYIISEYGLELMSRGYSAPVRPVK